MPRPDMAQLEPQVRAQIEAAYAAVDQALAVESPESGAAGTALGQLGRVLLAYDLVEAELALRNAASLMPDDARWPYYLGRMYRLDGRLDDAALAFSRARDLEPQSSLYWLRLAQVELDRLHLAEAEDAVLEALALDEDLAFGHYLLGLVRLEAQRPAEALPAFTRALELEPAADRIHYQLAAAYRNLGDDARSAWHLERRGELPLRLVDPLAAELEALKQSSNTAVARGNTHLAEGRLEDAREAFEQAIAQDPGNAVARLNLGVTLERLGENGRALEVMRSAVAAAPDDAKTWRGLGVLLDLAGERSEAEDALRRALTLDERDARTQRALADLLRRDGRFDAALPFYRAAIPLDPSDRLTRLYLAMCLVRVERHAEAIATLEQGLVAFPEDLDLHDALARVLATAPKAAGGNAERALEISERALARRRSIDTLETLGMALAAGGDLDAAGEALIEAIDLADTAGQEAWAMAMRESLNQIAEDGRPRSAWPDFLYQR